MPETDILWLEICGGLLALLQCDFFIKFTNIPPQKRYFIWYILLWYIMILLEMQFYLPSSGKSVAELLVNFLFVRQALKSQLVIATIAAMLVCMVNQLSQAFLVPLNAIWLAAFVTSPVQPAFLASEIGEPLLFLVIAYYSYRFILKKYQMKAIPQKHYVFIVLAPLLLLVLTMGLIIDMGYGTTTIDETGRILPVFNDYQILGIAAAALICMLAVLFAFKKLTAFILTENQGKVLAQQLAMQKKYVQETQERYHLTRAFRHDIKNHLLVLSRLLDKKHWQEASEYLTRLEESTAALSFPVHTGNAAMDALLSSKLGLARQNGIRLICDVTVPAKSSIDDFDFCIVFANALDNAIKACRLCGAEKYIRLRTRCQGRFFLLEIENSQNKERPIPKGLGLGIPNMQAIAEKYNGTLRTESTKDRFLLNILFSNLVH